MSSNKRATSRSGSTSGRSGNYGVAEDPPQLFPTWFRLAFATVLLILFSISYVVDILSEKYQVPGAFYPIMAIIVGAMYGSEALKGMKR